MPEKGCLAESMKMAHSRIIKLDQEEAFVLQRRELKVNISTCAVNELAMYGCTSRYQLD